MSGSGTDEYTYICSIGIPATICNKSVYRGTGVIVKVTFESHSLGAALLTSFEKYLACTHFESVSCKEST